MFKIQGKVVETTPAGDDLGGLTVLAIDTLDGTPAVITTTTTGQDGTFTLQFELGDVIQLFRGDGESNAAVLERVVTLYLSAMGGGSTLGRAEVRCSVRDLLDGTRCVDLRIARGSRDREGVGSTGTPVSLGACRYFARGTLRRADGSGVPSAPIELLEKRLRTEILLGTAQTAPDGSYLIVYGKNTPCDPTRPDKSIFARALDADGNEFASSEVHCDVTADVTIDLVVGNVELRGPARSTAVWQAIESRLDGLSLADLTADDVETLACATGQHTVQVAYLARSAQLEALTGVTREAFFAFANSGLPTTLVGVLGQDRDTLEGALLRGEAANIVPPWRTGQTDEILDALDAAAVDIAVPSTNPETSLLGELLLTGGVATGLPRQFVEGYLARTGTIETFWNDFRTTHGATTTDTVQFTLGVGALTGNHMPLIEELQNRRNLAEITVARDLATLTATDWLDIIQNSVPAPGAPQALPGANDGEREQNFATTLTRVFEDAFPTTATAGALGRATLVGDVVEFVGLNSTFDLGTTHIDAFLEAGPALPGGAVLEDLARDLKHVQRLHVVAPRFGRGDTVAALLGDGIVSAQQIYKMGYSAFAGKYEPSLGTKVVKQVWGKAAQQAAKVAVVATKYGSPFNLPSMHVLPQLVLDPEADGFPTIEALFGAQDFCACTHCRSVFGPAAYLTDLLKFLRDRPDSGGSGTLLDVLEARREGVVHTLLNCQNATTVMPTIDLVNEVLERHVATSPPAQWPQTTWTEAELRAHPEHLHQPAYDVLAAAVHPWILPFDLPLREARLYLDHLGVRLADLFEVIRGHDDAQAHAIALETLQLSQFQGNVVEDQIDYTQAPYNNVGAPWGLGATWAAGLAGDVRLFLKQASMSYEELLELLHVEYPYDTASPGPVTIEHAEGQPCTLEGATFSGWDAEKLGRVHRFVRLARWTGWSFYELDAATRALSLGTEADPLVPATANTEPTFLGRLSGVSRLLERWPDLPRLELLSWFGLLDTERGRNDEPSFYESVFLDRTVDPNNTNFAIADGATELTTTGALDIDADHPVIQAALNLSAQELAALLDPGPHGTVITQRTLESLSQLHRRASLSRALRLPVLDLLRLVSLSGREPFEDDPVSPTPDVASTRAFIELADEVRASGLSLAELDYVLRHRFEPSEGIALLRDRSEEIFVELIRGLQDIAAETAREADASTPALTVLGDRLGQVLDEAYVEAALQLIAGEDIGAVVQGELQAQLEEFLTNAQALLLFDPPQSAQDPRTAEQRAEDTLDALLLHVRDERMAALVVQKLSAAVGIESAAGDAVLRAITVGADDGVTLFLSDDFVFAVDFESDGEVIKTEGFPAQSPVELLDDRFETLELLHKIALVVTRLGLPTRHVQWLLDNVSTPGLGLLDLVGLPLAEQAGAAWDPWRKLARVVSIRDDAFRDPDALFELLVSATDDVDELHTDSQALLVQGTGWDADDLARLITDLAVDAGSIRALDGLQRLARAFSALRRFGISAARAVEWATTTVDAATAQAIKNATRSKHPPQRWPEIIGPLRDRLREQQRDALVAHVLSQDPSLQTPDDLLGELLIDVQGQSCQRTSRIVQATAAVQLFVQRLLLNLESPEALDDASAREWVWRRYYRVWEANRKVFLYPENYLEPELRDDQSPIFRELSADLMSADLTPQNAERAYVQYLRKVKEVARLEVAGIFHHTEEAYIAGEAMPQQIINDLHVFGRTLAPPYRYYYRKRVDETYWTAWEEVPLPIDTATVFPVVFNRRLLLMWPMYREVSTEEGTRYLEFQLAFSEFEDGAWTQPQLSDGTIAAHRKFHLYGDELRGWGSTTSSSRIFFETLVQDDRLVVQPLFLGHAFFRNESPNPGLGVVYDYMPAFIATEQAFVFVGAENKLLLEDAKDDIRPIEWPRAHPRPNLTGIRQQYFSQSRSQFEQNAAPATRQLRLFRPGTFDGKGAEVVMTPHLLVAASPFEVLAPHHNTHGEAVRFLGEDPFFYHDDRRAFFVWPRDPGEIQFPSFDGDGTDLEQLDGFNLGPYVLGSMLGSPGFSGAAFSGGGVLDDPPDQGEDDSYLAGLATNKRFWFFAFQHPFISRMLSIVDREGVAGLLRPSEDGDNADLRRQLTSELVMRQVEGEYEPNHDIVKVVARDELEFEIWGAYSLYNWEMFFHAPLLIAQRLRDAQRFEDAQKWYHYVFDPTDSSSDPTPQRFWNTKPLYEASEPVSIAEQLEALSYPGGDPDKELRRRATEGQIAQWQENPFNPHLMARLRPLAYQRATVMKYLDNLITWGDHLFRQATRETVGEALQLYVLATQILGPRPQRLESATPPERTFDELADDLDAFSNALVELENLVPPGNVWDNLKVGGKELTKKVFDFVEQPSGGFVFNYAHPQPSKPLEGVATFQQAGLQADIALLNLTVDLGASPEGPRALYFCVPPNDKLLGYWDTVADRLFKIRNCLDIEGVRLKLPLFQPPIDPALLVKAAAAGIDLASAIAALNAPRPHYRFRAMAPVAKELAAEVRTLGQALLGTLERKDAEALAELRATHEVKAIEAVERVFQERIAEVRQNIVALEAAKEVAVHRKSHFEELLENPTLESEAMAFDHSIVVEQKHRDAKAGDKLASRLAWIPDIGISVGVFPPSLSLSTSFGGSQISQHFAAKARALGYDASVLSQQASTLLTTAGITVRQRQWELEREQSSREIERIDQEILSARIRLDVATKELDNHRQEIARTRERETFLQQRFTRSELYGWMASEVQRVYHQAYQLAYDVAKRAERTYQFELAADDTSFIQFGYWDNQRKGLLAGDKLLHDIRRMETAYLHNNRREFELTKSVSVAMLDPVALVALRETGTCYVQVPEMLFDLDHPGHFLRRLKSVSVSISSKTGPLAEVPLTLTLVSSAIRTSPSTDASALVDDLTSGVQQIATMSAEDDDGLFERNFNDERYLPFEGRGAAGTWRIELPTDHRTFDYGSLSDVVLRLSFTARQGGDAFKSDVVTALDGAIDSYARHTSSLGVGLVTGISMRKTFPDDFDRFLNPPGTETPTLSVDVSDRRFPLKLREGEIRVSTLWLLAVYEEDPPAQPLALDLELPTTPDGSTTQTYANVSIDTALPPDISRIQFAEVTDSPPGIATTGTWELVSTVSSPPVDLEDLILVVEYTVQVPPP